MMETVMGMCKSNVGVIIKYNQIEKYIFLRLI